METNRIRQFVAIAESGSFRQAAEILNISHSGLSKSMVVLESEIGHSLFVKEGRGVVLSDFGRGMISKFRDVLDAEKALLQPFSKGQNKVLRIATFEVFSTYFTPEIVKLFPEHFFQLRERLPGDIEKALADNISDIGITYEPVPTAGIEHLRICEVEMGVFVAAGSFKKVTLDDLPFAAPIRPVGSSPSLVCGLDGWRDDLKARNIVYQVDMLESALALARQGLCAVFLPVFLAKLHNSGKQKLARLEFKNYKHKKHYVYIAKRKSTAEDRSFKKVAKVIRGVVR